MAVDVQIIRQNAERAALKLLTYCEASNWAGYDPYDALNSRIFRAVPLLNSRLPRLALTQVVKRCPIDIHRLALIPKTQNAKAMALFLQALLKLSKTGLGDQSARIDRMIDSLAALRSQDASYWCWGYSFPWQTRTVVVPVGTPNLVCTCFVANSLLDAYEERGDKRCLDMATSAARYIVERLYWTSGSGVASFSYPLPGERSQVHNASLLAAALLCRVYRHIGEDKLLSVALTAARYSVSRQRLDGSWHYGDAHSQKWIDNFHTGYNLCALQSISRYAETREFEDNIRLGFTFYRNHFFREDGAVKYYHDRSYPVDIHCTAQSIITLSELRHMDPEALPQAGAVLHWALKHMWDSEGFFHYRILRLRTVKASYMRWSQAWMLLAIGTFLSHPGVNREDLERVNAGARVGA